MAVSIRFFCLPAILICGLVLTGCGLDKDSDRLAPPTPDWPTDLVTPIEGATFSLSESHMPGASRQHHPGTHKGFDFFNGLSGRPLAEDEPVVAIADGDVVRIDHHYTEPSPDDLMFWTELVGQPGFTGDFALDRLRGRQVWLRHADGHISRYAHLSQVHPELQLGDPVTQDQAIGLIGNSGVPPTEDRAEPQPRLHFQLWAAGRDHYLGEELTTLEIHQQLAALFSDQALPRYARRMITKIEAGQATPDEYPPSPLPDTAFDVDLPDILIKGHAFAAAITWDSDQFKAEDFFAQMGGRRLGIIEAPDGAWILGSASAQAEEEELNLVVGAADAFGQTLVGGRQIPVVPPEDQPEPVEIDADSFKLYTDENREAESERLGAAAMYALQQRQPEWQQPFAPPLEGAIAREFSQPIFYGMLRPAHPSPGITIVPDADITVRASNDGTVAWAGNLPIRGNTVALIHGGGVVSVYAHLDEMAVEPGDRVARGDPLGTAGQSGAATEQQQVSWEIHVAGTPSNPIPWLERMLPGR